jgi:hypothetical protein
MTAAFVALTEVILMVILPSAPSPALVVLVTPVVALVFAAAMLAMCCFCNSSDCL